MCGIWNLDTCCLVNTNGDLLLICGPDVQYQNPSRVRIFIISGKVENKVTLMLFEINPSNTGMRNARHQYWMRPQARTCIINDFLELASKKAQWILATNICFNEVNQHWFRQLLLPESHYMNQCSFIVFIISRGKTFRQILAETKDNKFRWRKYIWKCCLLNIIQYVYADTSMIIDCPLSAYAHYD